MVNILKSFRKKSVPAMVTSADFQEEPKPEEIQLPGKYNIFGMPLEEACELNEKFNTEHDIYALYPQLCEYDNTKYVPIMVTKCIDYINTHGLKEEGLYRVSGSNQDIQILKNGFSQEGPLFDIPEHFDVHAVAGFLKTYLRELPETFLPVNKYTFLAYAQKEQPASLANFNLFTQVEEDLNPVVIPTQILQEILQDLPIYNFALVQQLSAHFQKIIDNTRFNKMTISNLSIILCHTFKIHKSVFHALILKENLWDGLVPASKKSKTPIFYNTNKILHYDPNECSSPELDSNYSDDTQTSFTSLSQTLSSPSASAFAATSSSSNTTFPTTSESVTKHLSFIEDFNPLETAFDEVDFKLTTKYSFELEKKYVRHPLYY